MSTPTNTYFAALHAAAEQANADLDDGGFLENEDVFGYAYGDKDTQQSTATLPQYVQWKDHPLQPIRYHNYVFNSELFEVKQSMIPGAGNGLWLRPGVVVDTKDAGTMALLAHRQLKLAECPRKVAICLFMVLF